MRFMLGLVSRGQVPFIRQCVAVENLEFRALHPEQQHVHATPHYISYGFGCTIGADRAKKTQGGT
jgi:hypothetical protein